jgi:hypothetical protein
MKIPRKPLVLAGLALAALAPVGSGPSASAQTKTPVTPVAPVTAQSSSTAPTEVIEHPRQYLAQAYPAVPLPLAGVADDRCFGGIVQGEPNARAVPGVLCLDTKIVSGVPRLNVDRFVTCPAGAVPFVQSYRLTKEVPSAEKCPATYESRVYHQFGTGIRTWWALQFTPPGTLFTLDVTVRSTDARTRKVTFHVDRWTWEVVATLDTLESVIHLLHTDAVGTTEVPCILGEDLYRSLIAGVGAIRTAKGRSRAAFEDAVFNLEGLVTACALFAEVVEADAWFSDGPPGNVTARSGLGLAGILETAENPCACKILVDIDYLFRKA